MRWPCLVVFFLTRVTCSTNHAPKTPQQPQREQGSTKSTHRRPMSLQVDGTWYKRPAQPAAQPFEPTCCRAPISNFILVETTLRSLAARCHLQSSRLFVRFRSLDGFAMILTTGIQTDDSLHCAKEPTDHLTLMTATFGRMT